MKIEPEQVNDLADFEYDVDGTQFTRLFMKHGGTEHMAKHLWNKVDGYNHSILKLWKSLDKENTAIVSQVLKAWTPRKNNCIQKQEL